MKLIHTARFIQDALKDTFAPIIEGMNFANNFGHHHQLHEAVTKKLSGFFVCVRKPIVLLTYPASIKMNF
ncbi:unnamed protein product [Larinioides sclopetarius]|uniref:Uncharacterized protein n=1 Tax=Larinioides sclopetarius TaxID=280406 RepID=A0AAV2BU17_9ARAC